MQHYLLNITLILLSVALNSSAQLLIKYAMSDKKHGVGPVSPLSLAQKLPEMAFNLWLWGAVAVYGVSFVLWSMVLSRVQVSFAFPFLALSFVIVVAAGHFLFGETFSWVRVVGVAFIVVGIVIIGFGGAPKGA
jgi:drug/metabolite transporter (DMT)-like permease